jgi:hypothetical protein
MTNVVNKANFAHYPQLLNMIVTCENLYDEVCKFLLADGKLESVKSMELYTDSERGYITMIQQLHEHVLESAEGEGLCIVQQQQQQEVQQQGVQTTNTTTTTNTTNSSYTEETQQADRRTTTTDEDATTTATTTPGKLEVTRKRVHYFCSPPDKASINCSDNVDKDECHDDDATIPRKQQRRRNTTATTDNSMDIAAITDDDDDDATIPMKQQRRRNTTATTDNSMDIAATTRRISTREKKCITRNDL